MMYHKLIIRYWYKTSDGKLWTTFEKPPQGIPSGVCLSDDKHIDSRDMSDWDRLPQNIRGGYHYCLLNK